jgi:NADPH:quinone reductase-like Zn-dependent oxidoreductase
VQALVLRAPGEIGWEEVPEPTPGPGEAVVAMRMAGFNHRDVWLWKGNFPISYPYRLLSDGVGRVVEVGPGVDPAWVGRDVVVNPSVGCGECAACAEGDEPACPQFRIFDGTAAQRVAIGVRNLVPKPSALADEEAAVLGLVFLTAYDMVVRRAEVRPGDRVLVLGANGGLGSAALQMVRLVGGHPFAVGSDEGYLRGLGAEAVVNHRLSGFEERVAALGPFDAVLDSVGAATFALSLKVLRRGGTLVTVGATTGGDVQLALGDIFRRRLAIRGTYMGPRAALGRLMGLFETGRLKPPAVTVLDPDQAEGAIRRLDEGGLRGKLALRIPEA